MALYFAFGILVFFGWFRVIDWIDRNNLGTVAEWTAVIGFPIALIGIGILLSTLLGRIFPAFELHEPGKG